jgi:Na+/glutamate symporter
MATDPDTTANGNPTPPVDAALEQRRLEVGRDLVGLGFVTIVAVFVISIIFLSTAGDVATAIAPVTTLVGTLIGAVFGAQLGSQGKEKAEAKRDQAEAMTQDALGRLPKDEAKAVVEKWSGR